MIETYMNRHPTRTALQAKLQGSEWRARFHAPELRWGHHEEIEVAPLVVELIRALQSLDFLKTSSDGTVDAKNVGGYRPSL